jgi:hypothetical protein
MTAGPAAPGEEPAAPGDERRRASLAKHVQRAIDRLSRSVSRADLGPEVRNVLEHALQELAALGERARGARGQARDAVVTELSALDGRMLQAARTAMGVAELDRLAADAAAELAAYRGRLAPDVWQRSVELGVDRLLRDRLGLPTLEM